MEKVRILSFDPGTADMGWSAIEGYTERDTVSLTDFFGVLKTRKTDGTVRERIDMLGNSYAALIQELNPTHVVIEDFTEQGKLVGKTYKEMSWLTEHLRLVGRELGYDVTIYENGVWKKLASGAARLSKDQVKHLVAHRVEFARELLGERTPTHVWDSVGIGYAKFTELIQGA